MEFSLESKGGIYCSTISQTHSGYSYKKN